MGFQRFMRSNGCNDPSSEMCEIGVINIIFPFPSPPPSLLAKNAVSSSRVRYASTDRRPTGCVLHVKFVFANFSFIYIF